MKKLYFLIAFLMLSAGALLGQSISVKSFKALPMDMTASSLEGKRIDQNGDVAALIKIVTTETGFTFEGGTLGIVDAKQETGEVWVWVPRAARKITIKHQKFGVLRDYRYPIEIEAERTYEMVLETKAAPEPKPDDNIVRQQYLIFQITPPDAVLEVDDQLWPVAEGTARKFVNFGTYTYRVQAPNYHPDAGRVTVDDPNNKKIVPVNLRPNFGWVEVRGGNAEGAMVYVDNAYVGKAPCKSEALKSGEHTVKIVREMYAPYTERVTVSDNETTTLSPKLTADFARVTLAVDADAEIWVNEEKKGTRSWTGNLATGTYRIECRLASHETKATTVEITNKMEGQTIILPAPTPIYGSLNVESTPDFAKIFIDGKAMGETPNFISQILIGTHELKLTKEGFNDYAETISISKGEKKQVNVTMNNMDYERIAKKGDEYYDAKNYEEALKCYREAAEHGNAVGQNGMGRLYHGGFGVQQDFAEAIRWYRLAAAQGLERSQSNLGLCYEYGQGVDQDYSEAMKWYRMAADQGYGLAQARIGSMYVSGKGVTQSYDEAMKWFRLAADQGNDRGQNGLGYMYYHGYGVTQDYVESMKWYRKSAEQGNVNGQIHLGYMYEMGYGIATDLAEAAKWYRKSAEQGNSTAQSNLGNMYQYGKGVTQDYNEAVKWYRKSAEQGSANGQINLGYMYFYGYGVTQDYAEANKWYRKAAEQGNDVAQYNLGVNFEYGNGVKKSVKEAKKWYQKAADQGYEDAIKALDRLK